ncbi:MAG TPA: 30S ribosomal protein S20 [Cyanobacteria bacterium UBA8530]|nr:30S ribosomal protein S20 [Cyanobacteria bacterium UBA8530]
MAKRIKSGIKRVEIAERNRLRNVAVKSEMKTRIKRVRDAKVEPEAVSKLLSVAMSTIDKAARKGIIHRNTAARRKSRLAKAVAKNA